jgi:hypothetical protein
VPLPKALKDAVLAPNAWTRRHFRCYCPPSRRRATSESWEAPSPLGGLWKGCSFLAGTMLVPGENVLLLTSGSACRVERLLRAGGQDEVYEAATAGSTTYALKWYKDSAASAGAQAERRVEAPPRPAVVPG